MCARIAAITRLLGGHGEHVKLCAATWTAADVGVEYPAQAGVRARRGGGGLADEPTTGLSRMLSEKVHAMLCDLATRYHLTVLLVDQEIRHALRTAGYVYVLEPGRNKFEGKASEFDDLEKAFWVA